MKTSRFPLIVAETMALLGVALVLFSLFASPPPAFNRIALTLATAGNFCCLGLSQCPHCNKHKLFLYRNPFTKAHTCMHCGQVIEFKKGLW